MICRECGYDCMEFERVNTALKQEAQTYWDTAKRLEEDLAVIYDYLKIGKGQDALRFLEAGQGE